MRISDRIKQRKREKEQAEQKGIIKPPSSDATPAPTRVSLTPSDRSLIRNFTVKGSSAFDEAGYSQSQIADFFARPEVSREMQRLAYLVENGEAILGRQQFLARVEIGETIPDCLTIVRRALRGQLPDANGNVLPVASLPDPSQVSLAMELLAMCGIDKTMLKQLAATNILDVELTEKRSTKDDGRYQMAQILQRERSRDALEQLTAILQVTDVHLDELKEKRKLAKERRKSRRQTDSGVE